MTTPKPGFTLGPGSSMAGTYLLAMRCPVQKRRESSLGFRAELENLVGDGKGKGTSGSPVRPKVPRRQPGADCSVIAWNRGNSRGAKGAGHPRRDLPESTGNRRNSLISTAGGSLQGVARAGWIERFKSGSVSGSGCNSPGRLGLGVKFPGPTRRRRG